MSNNQAGSQVSFLTAGVITTISITLVLFLLGTTFLVGFVGKSFSSYLKENMGISIELKDGANDESIAKLQKALDANPYIKSAIYISKDEVKKQLVEDLGRDPEEVLGYNPARSYFDIYIKSDYVNPDSIKNIEASLKGQNLVRNIVYNADDISVANSNLSKIGSVLFILAIILIFISFTLIRNTIQLHIYSKRFIINTMQLVGATNSFIRRPFILRTLTFGIIAAILANIAITAIVYYFTKGYPELTSIVKIDELLIVYATVIICGIMLTTLATVSAVNKYLRMTSNKLYHI